MLTALLPLIAMRSTLLDETNGVSWSVFPGDGAVAAGVEGVHDPTVVQIGSRFFCFHTSGTGFGLIRSSKDLKTWKTEGPILPSQPSWLAERYKHKSVWAPDVVALKPANPDTQHPAANTAVKLRCYYSISEWGTNKSVIGLAECERFDSDRPTEGWTDKGLVIESKQGTDVFNAIDPEVVVTPEERHVLFFGSYFAGIHAVEVDPRNGKLVEDRRAKPVCIARNTSERGNPLEGAAVCLRNGFYYLFVSYGLAGQGVRSTYRIMAGRSRDVMGPYVDRDGKSMVEGGFTNVLKTSPPMFSPGHCDVTMLNGRTYMPYHFYDGRYAWGGDRWGRPALQIRELLWSSDGWPLPGLPVEFEALKAANGVIGKWLSQADFGEPKEIELRKDGTIFGLPNPRPPFRDEVPSPTTLGKWTLDRDRLTLNWAKDDGSGEFWTDDLQLAYVNRYYVGRNQQGLVIRGFRLDP